MNLKLLALLLLPFTAQAETITLDPIGCGNIGLCNDVPNDGGFVIDLTYSAQYGQVSLTIDGVAYYSSPKSYEPWTGLVLTAADGRQAVITGSFTTTRVYVSNGRAHYYQTRWYFDGGTVTR